MGGRTGSFKTNHAVTHREVKLGLQNPQLVVDHEQAVRLQECGFRTAAVGRPMKMTFRIELDDDTSVAVLLHQVCMQSLDRLRAGGRKRERGGGGGMGAAIESRDREKKKVGSKEVNSQPHSRLTRVLRRCS